MSLVLAQLSDDIEALRRDFPVLSTAVNGKPLVYLDNAATTQKPKCVADRLYKFYTEEYATIHRGVYQLSQMATQYYDDARRTVADFLGAKSSDEIVFTRGTTEAINLVAHSFALGFLREGDEILISQMEHHANIVPWQEVCKKTGAVLKVAPILDNGQLDWDGFEAQLSERTKIMSVVHVSNALGTVNPVKAIVEAAHRVGAVVLLDGAQAVSHIPVDVLDLGCDFYVFSSHKLYGPTGVGVLYGRSELLAAMTPYQTGGDMIETVTFEKTTFAKPPARFEAGTPAIAEVLGLAEAISYVKQIGFEKITAIETALLSYATEAVKQVSGLKLIGQAPEKASVLSFMLDGVHPHDIGTILDEVGVAIRAGHHCAQPVMQFFSVPATARASFAFYNSKDDVDALVDALRHCQKIMLG